MNVSQRQKTDHKPVISGLMKSSTILELGNMLAKI